MLDTVPDALGEVQQFLAQGGPAMWVIAGLSVVTVALILWKLWRLLILGAWAGARARDAVRLWRCGDGDTALSAVDRARDLRSRVVHSALTSLTSTAVPEDHMREETERIAQIELARTRSGLRALELIATIAPLIGLLGTVLGMIEAFQALQDAGSRADPAALAGGIWEALLTTAAGMAVAIPASAALTWFESIADRVQADIEDLATQIFTGRHRGHPPQHGATPPAAFTAVAE
ncbi:MotA/TolQ/ExbB proton channel family protein [Actibacterium sp. 188UL27-1]|uniref:MotA/TolQ/ExbB proton channel family protein n=1 Tax=Actibacterium sp. 188UL27-1 TaxID=2786961 RepID=UPI00195B085F|nr:MotA/TolQ/ExbB proton channel family protein [Actibacterium sp. 188UL27-1]MBM7067081.1 MotA/TolQ/ExbB proton channel family protein [Actibacterium sp. 188UL27-1]